MALNLKALLAVIGVMVGCCSNVVFLELMVKHDPGSGNLITFSQFLFVALEGFFVTQKFGTKKRNIGFKDYLLLVIMFFVASVANNYAFDFNIPMPLHMIFRAGSLIANMVMGIVILRRRYAISKYFSVFLITMGIAICTIVSGSEIKQTKGTYAEALVDEVEPTAAAIFYRWALGIGLLTLALFVSAGMGIYQEQLYKRYGKHPFEALFYTHLLPLPAFLLFGGNILEHTKIAIDSAPVAVMGFAVPIVVLYILGNMVTQYMCISSVYVLTTECQSLTVTLVVTLRKFVSLVFSILYFKNDFTIYHWIGTFCVFYGTAVFTEVVPNIRKSLAGRKVVKEVVDQEKKKVK